MQKAQKRDACLKEKFWFKKNITDKDCDEWEEMTIDEIINGKGQCLGLIGLMNRFLASMEIDAETHCTIQQYLKLIQKRSSGQLLTTASWIRKEVLTHPDYKKDSVVSEKINFDLLKKAKLIQEGLQPCNELLGCFIKK